MQAGKQAGGGQANKQHRATTKMYVPHLLCVLWNPCLVQQCHQIHGWVLLLVPVLPLTTLNPLLLSHLLNRLLITHSPQLVHHPFILLL
jgi:hypothetical protein